MFIASMTLLMVKYRYGFKPFMKDPVFQNLISKIEDIDVSIHISESASFHRFSWGLSCSSSPILEYHWFIQLILEFLNFVVNSWLYTMMDSLKEVQF